MVPMNVMRNLCTECSRDYIMVPSEIGLEFMLSLSASLARARIQVACVVNQYPHSDCDELDIHAVIIGAQRGLRVSLRSKCSLESDNGRSRTVAESWVWERMVGYSSMVRRSLVVAVGVFHCRRTFEVHLLPVAVTELN